jgi:hypothetical protein
MTMRLYDAYSPEGRAVIRAFVQHRPHSRSPVSLAVVAAVLDVDPDAVTALATQAPLGPYTPEGVAQHLRARFALPPDVPIGQELARRGVLTLAEGRWLDDEP